jgi:hypothetical protein
MRRYATDSIVLSMVARFLFSLSISCIARMAKDGLRGRYAPLVRFDSAGWTVKCCSHDPTCGCFTHWVKLSILGSSI